MQTELDLEHSDMVRALKKPGHQIEKELTPNDCDLLHMSFALTIESGELGDAVKQLVFYRKELDYENVKEELGDMEFYMEGLRQNLGLSREETLKHNLKKLAKRYAKKQFSNEAATERADKPAGQ